ncbi:MAG: EAL domain-containing protein [Hyphomicrobiales bacterium]|nr:EAL domain-containing protein [Hyphomicrobiales bacterium]
MISNIAVCDMADAPDRTQQSLPASRPPVGPPNAIRATVPLCFVIDDDPSIRHFLSLILHGSGLDAEEFADGGSLRQALERRSPELVFLNVGLESAATVEIIVELGRRSYRGFVQLMSSRGSAVLEHVRAVGEQHRLQMLPVLKKPFDAAAIIALMRQLKLGHGAPQAARVDLGEALSNRWIEFWYQPKIDLRKKQLAGIEAFARCRHPESGVLPPETFMPGATETELVTLSELAITSVLQGGQRLARLGINLRFAVDIPVPALTKLKIPDLLRTHLGRREPWPGLMLDLAEEQIVTDLALATKLAKTLAPVNVKLAIDNFGRGYSTVARIKELPFAEFKLDQTFVTDCATDKVNAPLCRTVIDLAHGCGGLAVALGIEKASDALALTSMGCDLGQGFLLGEAMPEERLISLLRHRAAGQGRTLPKAANG